MVTQPCPIQPRSSRQVGICFDDFHEDHPGEMIKFLRNLFFGDFWLKLFSLTLAILIWLAVSFAVQKEPQMRTFSNLPVRIISSSHDVSNYKVRPDVAEVTLQGERNLVRDLRANEIKVLVDLTGSAAGYVRKRLEVATLPGISFVRVEPLEVEVVFPSSQ